MLEQEMLREQFQALLDREKQAVEAYAGLARQLDNADSTLRQHVRQLCMDKKRHVQLTERLPVL
ncbi:MAG: hypothetical protein KAU28_04280 [Phycisphaerae bacterium]|nr:hypothetical protein [Phycisphaerae bacterium]